VLWRVTEIVDEISSSEYAIDPRLSRLRWKLVNIDANIPPDLNDVMFS